MSNGWMRVREAAHLMGVSQSTVRRRVDSEELRGRTGKSGRQEVFLPAKLRRELEATQAKPNTPGHMDRGKTPDEVDAIAKEKKAAKAEKVAAQKQPAPAMAEADRPSTSAAEDSAEADGDLLKRYERLAGGSLILAQQHSDAVNQHKDKAYEQLAHTRNQVRHLRKLALAGWGSCAAVLALLLVMTVTLGMGKARAEAAASASDLNAERAERRAQTMSGLLLDARDGTEDAAPETTTDMYPTPDSGTRPGRHLHGPTVSVPSE